MFIHNDWKPSSYHDILAAAAMFLAWWLYLLGAVVGWRFLKDLMNTPPGFGFATGFGDLSEEQSTTASFLWENPCMAI